ncbi:hypothetical protein NHX12_028039 [Muraenolepis orangiensis]|uniref:Uncharacterized protein n=1 Tax=Muraenolepis orangiensis TaxID=630683 RepID=A0A9Q0IR15_9TELE|nr:hypothetical protein NHX12_028039 [Muraenolepis orangiensis]
MGGRVADLLEAVGGYHNDLQIAQNWYQKFVLPLYGRGRGQRVHSGGVEGAPSPPPPPPPAFCPRRFREELVLPLGVEGSASKSVPSRPPVGPVHAPHNLNLSSQGEDRARTGRGPGEDRARTGRGPGEDRARTGRGQGEDRARTGRGQGEDRARTGRGQGEDRARTGRGQGEDRARTGRGQGEDRARTGRGQGEDRARTGRGQGEDRARTGRGQGEDRARTGRRCGTARSVPEVRRSKVPCVRHATSSSAFSP